MFPICIWLLWPADIAYAHNCSNFWDCYDTLRAAVASTVGLGMFAVVLSTLLDITPGQNRGLIEAITGKEAIKGQDYRNYALALGVLSYEQGAVLTPEAPHSPTDDQTLHSNEEATRFDDPDVWINNEDLLVKLYELKEEIVANGEQSMWALEQDKLDVLYDIYGIHPDFTPPEKLFDAIAATRVRNELPETYDIIDVATIDAIIDEELNRQAADTFGKRIPLHLDSMEWRIRNSDEGYLHSDELSDQDILAIQGILGLYQSGVYDEKTLNKLENNKALPHFHKDPHKFDETVIQALRAEYEESMKRAEENPTRSAIEEFMIKHNIGDEIYAYIIPSGGIPRKITNEIAKKGMKQPAGVKKHVESKVAKETGDVKLSSNLENHIKNVDPSVPRRRGIGGAHNKEEFYKNEVNVLNVERHPSMSGVEKITYQVPSVDGKTGEITGWKATKFNKTVYDPKVVSDEQYIRLGKEAAQDASAKGVLGREWTGYDSQGVKWRGYATNGEITSFYPEF